jgi:hypothetical protein
MSQHLTETLKTLQLERKKETLRKGWQEVPSWVFTTGKGAMVNPDNFRSRDWPKLLAKAQMRQFRRAAADRLDDPEDTATGRNLSATSNLNVVSKVS